MFYKPKGEIENIIIGNNITECWLNLCNALMTHGYSAITPKDEGMGKELRNVLIKVPLISPRTHKNYGGLAKREGTALNNYIWQVAGEGSHEQSPHNSFKYTYHQRLRHYGTKKSYEQGGYDQIQTLTDLILPFKRSYQCSTWYVPEDNEADKTGGDQPCLVILWGWLGWDTTKFPEETQLLTKLYQQSLKNKVEYSKLLHQLDLLLLGFSDANQHFKMTFDMHCIWRNRDAGSAWLDNVCAMDEMMNLLCVMLGERFKIPISIGHYYDFNLAIQIYPRDFEAVREVIK